MKWLEKIVDEIEKAHPTGEIVVSSGVTPSGKYHLGTLREVLTAEVIARELKNRDRKSKHIHIADDFDVFRKVPVGIPADYEKYLGKPLVDIPAPDNSSSSYADYYLSDLNEAKKQLNLDMEIIRASEKYRAGFFKEVIEKALSKADDIKKILEEISGRKLGNDYSPIQVVEEGYLKNREFRAIDTNKGVITYLDPKGVEQSVDYTKGKVKLNWRIDWPARWSLMKVNVEPFGRDHATKGGSYDTGVGIVKKVFDAKPPLPVPYNFINRTGDTKKMSKSAGETITISDLLRFLPVEVVWYFMLRFSPDKLLFFDDGPTFIRLMDEYKELLAKTNRTAEEQKLLELCRYGQKESLVSRVPYSHMVNAYQASLKDGSKAMDVIRRTEHGEVVDEDKDKIKAEFVGIDHWLEKGAPEEVKFQLAKSFDVTKLSDQEKEFLSMLAQKASALPKNAEGEAFHKAIYDSLNGFEPKQAFKTLYRVLINKDEGPRAGWFLSILDRDWLIKRLKLEA